MQTAMSWQIEVEVDDVKSGATGMSADLSP